MSALPIGVFDSGVGGLSTLQSIRQLLPHERLIYVADSAHAPYGPKGDLFIQQRSLHIAEYLLRREVKAIVVACNTATAAAIALLRERYELPVIGVEPAVKPAAEHSHTSVVGVLATTGTIASDKFENLKSRFSDKVQILTRACPGLVELIEQVRFDEAKVTALLREFIEPMLEKKADTLVLGCTHYSLIKTQIQNVAGPDVTIVDAGLGVARELQRRLQGNAASAGQVSPIEFFTSADPVLHRELVQRYWPEPVTLQALP